MVEPGSLDGAQVGLCDEGGPVLIETGFAGRSKGLAEVIFVDCLAGGKEGRGDPS